MNARIAWALAACLSLVGCVDTGAESWCEDHDAICKTTISVVEPAEGPTTGGTPLTIRGAALEAGGELFLGGNRLLNVVYKSRNEVQATSPIGSTGPALLRIVNLNGEFEFPGKFTFRAPSVVQSVTPRSAPKWGGTQVTLLGTDFHPGTRLFVADQEVVPVIINPERTTLSGTVPPHSTVGEVPLRLEGPGGTMLVDGVFRYVAWERRIPSGFNDIGGVRWMARGGTAEVFYVGTNTDLYRSDDGLASWTRVVHPAVEKLARDNHLVVDPVDGQRVYFAASSLYRSSDGGMNWARTVLTDNGQEVSIRALALRPTDRRLFAASDQSLFYSDNQGASFTRLSGHTVPDPRQLRVHPSNGDGIHLLGQSISATSSNGGVTFAYVDTQEVTFAEPGLGAAEFWYGTNSGELRRSQDLGLTWSTPPETSPVGVLQAFFSNPATARYVLADYNQLYELDPSNIPVAWNPLLEFREVSTLLADVTGRLIVAGGTGVVRREVATGNKFSVQHQGLESPSLQALAQDASGIYAGTRSGKVAFSSDQGRTWEDRGTVFGTRAVISLAVVQEASESVLYAVVEGEQLFRKAPGLPWTPVVDGWGGPIQGQRLQTLPADPNLLFLIPYYGLYRKDPLGNWVSDVTGIESASYLPGVVSRFDGFGLQLYTMLGGGGVSSQAYTRPAIGTSAWTPVGNLVPETFGYGVGALAATPNALVALVGNNRVARMPFDTQTWQLLPETGDSLAYSKFLFTAPAPSQTVYAGGEYLFFRSDDSGATWRAQDLELFGGWAKAGLVDRDDPNLVLLPANSGGLVVSQTGGE
ncbi:MAG: IPT/TIG domain-containing protein [Myxococcota bacterium]|nr:IPT/TIG domain-containing protein [Myxococcota bacterium]